MTTIYYWRHNGRRQKSNLHAILLNLAPMIAFAIATAWITPVLYMERRLVSLEF